VWRRVTSLPPAVASVVCVCICTAGQGMLHPPRMAEQTAGSALARDRGGNHEKDLLPGHGVHSVPHVSLCSFQRIDATGLLEQIGATGGQNMRRSLGSEHVMRLKAQMPRQPGVHLGGAEPGTAIRELLGVL
jgi:hypothetical protein